ncbi:MAG: hypothetical protein KUG69_12060 [Marinosulfonomonas sp.]|nr:hypothetical protein [Marinosulfonomonas sp.]
MGGEIDFTPFLLGTVLGIALSVLLEIRFIAVSVATVVVVFVLREFLQGGHEALIEEATRLARFAQQGQASGYISGMLVGKMASGVRRSLVRRPHHR